MVFSDWRRVLEALKAESPGTILRMPKNWLPHPEDAGAKRAIGMPMGQRADFRWRLSDCSGFHIRDFGSFYEAHIDQIDPSCDPVEHLRQDAPGGYVAGAAALGALFGLLLGGGKDAALVGAGLGTLVGVATLPPKSLR